MNNKKKELMSLISENKDLQEKLININDKYPDEKENKKALIAFASECGIELTEADFESSSIEELDEAELVAVAGGEMVMDMTTDKRFSRCVCAYAGYGASDSYQKTCVCALGGAGELTEFGKTLYREDQLVAMGSSKAPVAFFCALAGLVP